VNFKLEQKGLWLPRGKGEEKKRAFPCPVNLSQRRFNHWRSGPSVKLPETEGRTATPISTKEKREASRPEGTRRTRAVAPKTFEARIRESKKGDGQAAEKTAWTPL